MVAAKVWVSGLVQGVGFRYFVLNLARRFGLKGEVKNLYDGRVYIEVEGNEEIIREFLRHVKIGNRWSDVKQMEIQWEKYSGKYSSFEITY